ncbi:MAG: hypothetical protein V7636_1550 [Actinomycetota bacterium]|jgi:hypothetical protein
MEPDKHYSDAVVIGLVVAALVLGVALYNIIPLPKSSSSSSDSALVPTTTTVAAQPTGSSSSSSVDTGSTSSGGLFGSATPALQSGETAETNSNAGVDVPDTPTVPAPTCPTSVANDAYEQVSDPVSAALGKPLPRDNVRMLAEIGAGCSNESAATPVIGLALDLSRLVPNTGIPAVPLTGAVPDVSAPTIPPAIIDALGPIADPIREGCANVALIGVLIAVLPGAAQLPIYGSDLAKAIVPADTLCAQFER